MPLKSELKAVIRNLGIEETEQVLTIGELSQTQKMEITIESKAEPEINDDELNEKLITEVAAIGEASITQTKETENIEIEEYNPAEYGEILTIRAITDSGAIINNSEEYIELLKEITVEEKNTELIVTIPNNVEDIKKVEKEETVERTEEEIKQAEEMGIFFAGEILYEEIEEARPNGLMSSNANMTITTSAGASASYTLSHGHQVYYPGGTCYSCNGTGGRTN